MSLGKEDHAQHSPWNGKQRRLGFCCRRFFLSKDNYISVTPSFQAAHQSRLPRLFVFSFRQIIIQHAERLNAEEFSFCFFGDTQLRPYSYFGALYVVLIDIYYYSPLVHSSSQCIFYPCRVSPPLYVPPTYLYPHLHALVGIPSSTALHCQTPHTYILPSTLNPLSPFSSLHHSNQLPSQLPGIQSNLQTPPFPHTPQPPLSQCLSHFSEKKRKKVKKKEKEKSEK